MIFGLTAQQAEANKTESSQHRAKVACFGSIHRYP